MTPHTPTVTADTLELVIAIDEAEHTLAMCEVAAKHLTGIPKRQNEVRMERLCDRLTELNIQRIEAVQGPMSEARKAQHRGGSRHV